MYPGLCAEVELHLWRSIGLPILIYEPCDLPLAHVSAHLAEKAQSDLRLKWHIQKPSHHFCLLSALGLPPVRYSASAQCQSLLASPMRTLNLHVYLLGRLLLSGVTGRTGTLVFCLLSASLSPIKKKTLPSDGCRLCDWFLGGSATKTIWISHSFHATEISCSAVLLWSFRVDMIWLLLWLHVLSDNRY
jgi:hypothetical protein